MAPAIEIHMKGLHLPTAFLLLFLSGGLKGQDISQVALKWISTSTTDLRTSEARSYNSTFISRDQEIQWLQKGAQNVKTFHIVQQIGSWTDVSVDGSITFKVTEGGSSGTIVFERSAGGISVTLDFSSHGEMAIKRRFGVSEIEADK